MRVVKNKEATQQKQQKSFVKKTLNCLWNPIDTIGQSVIGDLWPIAYETTQDSIAVGFLYIVPGKVVKLLVGNDFSSLNQCLEIGDRTSIYRYSCFVIVAAGFSLWIVVAARLVFRSAKTLISINK